jgi:rRNA maturation RNase YbeY
VRLQNIVEILKLNIPMAMKIALDGLLDYNYSTRDTSISDVGRYDKVEVSVLLCNDNFIQNLNKEWRGEDCAADMLSMSQYIPDLDVPTVSMDSLFECISALNFNHAILFSSFFLMYFMQLMLGDIAISVETAARQAEEKGVTLLDEVRVLVVCSSFTFTLNFLDDDFYIPRCFTSLKIMSSSFLVKFTSPLIHILLHCLNEDSYHFPNHLLCGA